MILKYPEYVIMGIGMGILFTTIVWNIINIDEDNNVYNIVMDIIIFVFCLASLLIVIGRWIIGVWS